MVQLKDQKKKKPKKKVTEKPETQESLSIDIGLDEEEDEMEQKTVMEERLIWGTDIIEEEVITKFRKFIENYKKSFNEAVGKEEGKYIQYLRVVKENGKKNININMSDLLDFDKKIYYQTIDYPQEIIPTMDQVVQYYYDTLFNDNELYTALTSKGEKLKEEEELVSLIQKNQEYSKSRKKRLIETHKTKINLLKKQMERIEECKVQKIDTRPFGLVEKKSIRLLNPEDLVKLISFKGMVARVCPVIPELTAATFSCLECGGSITSVVEKGRIREPRECGLCKSKEIYFSHNESHFIDKQIIKIQETPESIPAGQTPQTVNIMAFEGLVDNVKPGDRVIVTGIYRAVEKTKSIFRRNLSTLFNTYIDVLHFETEKKSSFDGNERTEEDLSEEAQKMVDDEMKEFDTSSKKTSSVGISDDEIDFFEKIAKHKNGSFIYRLLTKSVAPNTFGMKNVKRGILCQMFGGVNKKTRDGNMTIRGDLHVLLIGDPGTSKSQLLLHVNKISTRGIYTSGKGSSSVGLTAYVTKDQSTGEYILESGALVLSDNGICTIDEFDKMGDATRSVLHEVMEQQTVSIAKAGIVCSLNARTSVLASANPVESKFNDNKSVVYNVNLPPTLLSRFDMIFVVRDSTKNDKKLAQHILKMYGDYSGLGDNGKGK